MASAIGGRPGEPPPVAARIFGPALATMERYAALLASAGVERGLIGPREADRLWDRHLVNCAVVAPALRGPSVIDLGSGAGLPGLVLAAMRPDLRVVLLDATQRRVRFLDEAIGALGLSNVTTRWARAEAVVGALTADEVIARAVAPLDRLAAWSLPLLRPGGRLHAIKGETAEAEAAAGATAVVRLGGTRPVVRRYGTGLIDPPVAVIEVDRRTSSRQRGVRR